VISDLGEVKMGAAWGNGTSIVSAAFRDRTAGRSERA
jgi:hypothetical protein